jgi:poly(A) polymerase
MGAMSQSHPLPSLDLPGVPPLLVEVLVDCAGNRRLAMVGGAVRDLLLHRVHNDPWRGLPDLDLVVEGVRGEAAAVGLAQALERSGRVQVRGWREHGAYCTVEIELQLAESPGSVPPTVLLDVATARRESYPLAAGNPQVNFAALDDDLARRDFSINAMALLLSDPPQLLDPHGGQADLGQRRLRFLHAGSVRDDPTRVLRAARYAARLEFMLADSSLLQLRQTLAAWPWPWRPGDPPEQAPPALGTRLRMELQLLLERESWPEALAALQDWGALTLLDPALQADRRWRRRLRWAEWLGLERMVALLAAAEAPLALAERLQLPHRQQRLLAALEQLRALLAAHGSGDGPGGALLSVAEWTQLLETPGLPAETVALALVAGVGPRRPLLRWWLRWRHLRCATSAADLIAREGLRPGPALGARLRHLRGELLNRERF